jgi:hypothetical protein
MSQTDKENEAYFREPTDYSGCTITDIKRRKGTRADRIGAILRDKNGQILITADLDYILDKLHERIPGKPEDDYDNEL